MTDWTWALAGCATRAYGGRELSLARGRNLTIRVDGHAVAQFSIDGRSDEAAEIVSLATDLIAIREGVDMFRGRIGPENDDIDPTRHLCQFTALDYRGLLQRRMTGAAGAVFAGVNVGAIAWSLINTSQAQTSGNLGITDGIGSGGGSPRSVTVIPGKPILETITELSHLDPGMEWEIGPDLALNRWYPTRGSNTGFKLDYGGTVSRIWRTFNPDDYANVDLATGIEGLTPAVSTSATIGTDERGRWETSQGFPTVERQDTLDAKAPWMLGQTNVIRPEWIVQLASGQWDPATMWVGDTGQLSARSGRVDVDADHRIVEINVQPGDHGTETVKIGLVAA